MANVTFPIVRDIVLTNKNESLTTYPTGIFAISPRLSAVDSSAKVLTIELALQSVSTGLQVEILQTVRVNAEGVNTGKPTNQKAIDKELAKQAGFIADLEAAQIAETNGRTEIRRLKDLPEKEEADIEIQRQIIQESHKTQTDKREKLEAIVIPEPIYAKEWKYDDVVKYFTDFEINETGIIAIKKLPYNDKTIGHYI